MKHKNEMIESRFGFYLSWLFLICFVATFATAFLSFIIEWLKPLALTFAVIAMVCYIILILHTLWYYKQKGR